MLQTNYRNSQGPAFENHIVSCNRAACSNDTSISIMSITKRVAIRGLVHDCLIDPHLTVYSAKSSSSWIISLHAPEVELENDFYEHLQVLQVIGVQAGNLICELRGFNLLEEISTLETSTMQIGKLPYRLALGLLDILGLKIGFEVLPKWSLTQATTKLTLATNTEARWLQDSSIFAYLRRGGWPDMSLRAIRDLSIWPLLARGVGQPHWTRQPTSSQPQWTWNVHQRNITKCYTSDVWASDVWRWTSRTNCFNVKHRKCECVEASISMTKQRISKQIHQNKSHIQAYISHID